MCLASSNDMWGEAPRKAAPLQSCCKTDTLRLVPVHLVQAFLMLAMLSSLALQAALSAPASWQLFCASHGLKSFFKSSIDCWCLHVGTAVVICTRSQLSVVQLSQHSRSRGEASGLACKVA